MHARRHLNCSPECSSFQRLSVGIEGESWMQRESAALMLLRHFLLLLRLVPQDNLPTIKQSIVVGKLL